METIDRINKAFEFVRKEFSSVAMIRLCNKEDISNTLKETVTENKYFRHEIRNLWLSSDKDNMFGNIYLPLTEDVYMVFEVQNKRN